MNQSQIKSRAPLHGFVFLYCKIGVEEVAVAQRVHLVIERENFVSDVEIFTADIVGV